MITKYMYIIDASSLIDLEELVPKNFFQPLFESFKRLIDSGVLITTEEVLQELKGKDGDIYHWAKKQKNLFKKIDAEQLTQAKEILEKFPKLIDTEKRNGADPFLIALALKKETQQTLLMQKTKVEKIVVTEEKASENLNKPKIPDVCKQYNIGCINLNDFLHEEMEIKITLKNDVIK